MEEKCYPHIQMKTPEKIQWKCTSFFQCWRKDANFFDQGWVVLWCRCWARLIGRSALCQRGRRWFLVRLDWALLVTPREWVSVPDPLGREWAAVLRRHRTRVSRESRTPREIKAILKAMDSPWREHQTMDQLPTKAELANQLSTRVRLAKQLSIKATLLNQLLNQRPITAVLANQLLIKATLLHQLLNQRPVNGGIKHLTRIYDEVPQLTPNQSGVP